MGRRTPEYGNATRFIAPIARNLLFVLVDPESQKIVGQTTPDELVESLRLKLGDPGLLTVKATLSIMAQVAEVGAVVDYPVTLPEPGQPFQSTEHEKELVVEKIIKAGKPVVIKYPGFAQTLAARLTAQGLAEIADRIQLYPQIRQQA